MGEQWGRSGGFLSPDGPRLHTSVWNHASGAVYGLEGPQGFPGEAVAGALHGCRGGAGSGETEESMMDGFLGCKRGKGPE